MKMNQLTYSISVKIVDQFDNVGEHTSSLVCQEHLALVRAIAHSEMPVKCYTKQNKIAYRLSHLQIAFA